jgi:hypothetical protein
VTSVIVYESCSDLWSKVFLFSWLCLNSFCLALLRDQNHEFSFGSGLDCLCPHESGSWIHPATAPRPIFFFDFYCCPKPLRFPLTESPARAAVLGHGFRVHLRSIFVEAPVQGFSFIACHGPRFLLGSVAVFVSGANYCSLCHIFILLDLVFVRLIFPVIDSQSRARAVTCSCGGLHRPRARGGLGFSAQFLDSPSSLSAWRFPALGAVTVSSSRVKDFSFLWSVSPHLHSPIPGLVLVLWFYSLWPRGCSICSPWVRCPVTVSRPCLCCWFALDLFSVGCSTFLLIRLAVKACVGFHGGSLACVDFLGGSLYHAQ